MSTRALLRCALVFLAPLGLLGCPPNKAITYRANGSGAVSGTALLPSTLCDDPTGVCVAPLSQLMSACLTATPAANFSGWSCNSPCASPGSSCNGPNQCQVNSPANNSAGMTCVADFCVPRLLTLATQGGSGNLNTGGLSWNGSAIRRCSGDVLSLSAAPRQGFLFDHWTGDAACVDQGGGAAQVIMDADHTCTAVFRQPVLTLVALGGGSISADTTPALQCPGGGAVCQQSVAAGLTVTVTALRSPGAALNAWGADCGGSPSVLTRTLLMDADKRCTVAFSAPLPIGVNDSDFTQGIVSIADDETLGDGGPNGTGTTAQSFSCCQGATLGLSAGASQVAFVSESTNLIPGSMATATHSYVRDRTAGTTRRYNLPAPQGPYTLPEGSHIAGLSSSGRRALYGGFDFALAPAFQALQVYLANLGLPGFATGHSRISFYDASAGVGTARNNGGGIWAALSANGRYVAFQTTSELALGDFIAVRDTCFGAPPGCTPASHLVVDDLGAPITGTLPQISADGRLVYFLHGFLHPPSGLFLTQPFLIDRDSDGNDVFDEPGGTATMNAVQGLQGFGPTSHVQSFTIDASGRYVGWVEPFSNALRKDTCLRAPSGCAVRNETLALRVNGSISNRVDDAQLSASGRFAALVTRDPLMFGTDPTILGSRFGVVRDTCLGQNPLGCIPANHEVTVRQSDGGRGAAFNTALSVSQDGTLAVITGMRSDYFPALPNMSDLFLALTGFPHELGGTPSVLRRFPGSATAGSPPLLVTITGSGFVPGSVVRRLQLFGPLTINTTYLATTFVSRERVQALLDFNDLATPQVLQLDVQNPSGGKTGVFSFVVN